MNKSKIACGLIVKDDTEIKGLKRCLDSVAPYVDGIYITATQKPHQEIEKLSNQYGAHLDIRPGDFNYTATKEEVKWLEKFLGAKPTLKAGDTIFQFAKARNANLDFIPDKYEWFFWIDADDVLLNGKELHLSAERAQAQGAEAIFLNYIYEAEFTPQGKIKNIIIQHLRERLVRIDGDYRKVYKWIGNIHETIIQQTETRKIEDKTMEVLHLSSRDRFMDALHRNMKVLEHDIYATQGKDPRPIYYLGKALFDLRTDESFKQAEKLMLAYLSPKEHASNMSGWKEERAQAWEYLGEIYRGQGHLNNSIKALANALIEYPQSPTTYFSMALTYMLKEEYDTARFWVILGSKVPPAKTTLVSNPRDIEARAYEVLYNAGIKLNKIDEAWEACAQLKQMFPDDSTIDEQWKFINETREIRDQLKSYAGLVNYLASTGQTERIRALIAAAPAQLQNNPYYLKLAQDMTPPKDWTDNEIAIYCGPQFTQWDPTSVETTGNAFIGGSEEAVIYMAKELAKKGWKPVVFADPIQEGVYDGVEYLSHFKFNYRDNFSTLIYWRAINFTDMDCKAKKTFIWLHDVQNPVDWTKERLARIDKIIVLSEAHRKTLPDVPDEKFIISTNGFTEDFPNIKSENNSKDVMWTSSYDRGLQNLLEIWPDVIKEVPDAKLHIFYGWKLYAHFYRGNPERMAWMQKMQKLMTQKGVVDHDRVPQPELEKWHKKCGVFAYPSHFYEINCISAIKAQAFGDVPVVTDFAALSEVVQYGEKVKGEIWENFALSPEAKETYKQALISILKDEKKQSEIRKEMIPVTKKKYTWEAVATEWDKFLKEDYGKTRT